MNEKLLQRLHDVYPQAEALYYDAIISVIGESGFLALHRAKMIELCGVIHGRHLYAI